MKNIVKSISAWVFIFVLAIGSGMIVTNCQNRGVYPSPTVSGVLKGASRPSYIPMSDYAGDSVVVTHEEFVNNKISSGTYTPDASDEHNVSQVKFSTAKYTKVDSVVTLTGKLSAYAASYSNIMEFSMSLPTEFASISNVSGVLLAADNSQYTDGAIITGYAVGDTSIQCKYATNHSGNATISYNITFQVK